jgi:hypothetical protein
VFTFALVSTDAEPRGLVVLPKRDWLPGDLIPPGQMRVVDVLEPEQKREGRYPVLVVERVE